MPPSGGDLLGAIVIGGLVTASAIPPVAVLARKVGIMDHPGGYKVHARPTPYLGGSAVLLGVTAGILVVIGTDSQVSVVLVAAALICMVGTLDDRRPIAPAIRVLAQAAIGAAVWAADAGWQSDLPEWINLCLTVGWVVVAANALNLIDNLDGTSASAAAASAVGIGAMALTTDGKFWGAILAAATFGACLGFLSHNLAKPARIFLGDGGSTLLGFLLAVGTMAAFANESSASGCAVSLLLVGVPLFDTAVAVASRRRRGAALTAGGCDHATHRLNARVGSTRKVAGTVALAQLLLAGIAIAAVVTGPAAMIAATAVYLLSVGATAWFDTWPAGRGITPQSQEAGQTR